MATHLKVGLKVVVRNTKEAPGKESKSAEAFWSALTRGSQRISPSPEQALSEGGPQLFETRLRSEFPRQVRRQLRRYFARSPHERALKLSQVGVRVASITYGSLDLALEFTGAQHLIELFDGNLDVFISFAEAYLPVAFNDVMVTMGLPTLLLYDVIPDRDMIVAFATAAVTPTPVPHNAPLSAHATTFTPMSPPSESAAAMRAQKLWRIANYTLVVPVALALLVLYLQAKVLADDKTDLKELRKELAEREQTLSKAMLERIGQLEKMQGELLTMVRDASKPADTKSDMGKKK